MSGNGITSGGNSAGFTNGSASSSGYRVSMVGGALEVSARLSTPEELDLLVNVLEANKTLWASAPVSEPRPQPKATRAKLEFLDGMPAQKAELTS
jgi:hypothetical protein